MWSRALKTRAVVGAVALVAAVLLAVVDRGLLGFLSPQAPLLGAVAAAAGGGGTLVGAFAEARQRRDEDLRAEIDRLVDGYRWTLESKHGVSTFDVGVAVWRPRRRRERVDGQRRHVLDCRLYRSRSRHRHVSTGITWTVGKGVIGRCLETGDVVAEDLRALWGPLRACSRREWEQLPVVDVRQRLTHEEFLKALGTGSVIRDGHLTQVVAVPVLTRRSSRPLACVAVDVPPGSIPDVGPTHDLVQGLSGIADAVARALES